MCGMTQAEFSECVGMSLNTVRSWEQGNKNHRQCKKWVYDLIVYFLSKEGYLK